VLGGRFDPPHLGHLMIAQEAWWRLRLDELIFVPVGAPADRPTPHFAGDLRVAMVEAAIDAHPGWRCSRTEIDRPGPSYTADTLAELAARDAGFASALARANGWERRLDRARNAFKRPTKITHPLILEQLGSRSTFGVTGSSRSPAP